MSSRFCSYFPIDRLALLVAFLISNFANAAVWLPITDEERAYTKSEIDPNAGAEVLYKSIESDDGTDVANMRKTYVRIKIYDERGVASVNQITISYSTRGSKLGALSARVVKPDDSVVEIEKGDFYDKMLQRDSQGSVKAKSFSFTDLSPGDIVEYQYRINLDENYYSPEVFVAFQERWPIRHANIRVRPSSGFGVGNYIKWMTSKCDSSGMDRKPDGFYELDVVNMPSHLDEPHQPPEKAGVAWLLFYLTGNSSSGDAYWKGEAQKLYRIMESQTKAGKEVKATLKTILEGVSDDEEKLRKIYSYCVTEIVNARHGANRKLTPDDRKKIRGDMSAEKVLAQGYGSPRNINTVFCALARAAGFDARMAAVGDRTSYTFRKVLMSKERTLRASVISVRDGDQWQYFDPGGKYLPYGRLNWQNEGVSALIADKKKLELQVVGFSKVADSMEKRAAKLQLDEKGYISGKVEIELIGHYAVEAKRVLDNMAQQGRREHLEEGIRRELWPEANVSSMKMMNVMDPLKPLKISFELEPMPFADVVGDRIFLQTNVFRKASTPEFPESERISDLFFDHTINELDQVEIKLPDNYELEQASAPRPFNVETVIEYEPTLGIKKKSNTLVYSRAFRLSGVNFPVRVYGAIKSQFDEKHRQDQHTITLKKVATEVSSL